VRLIGSESHTVTGFCASSVATSNSTPRWFIYERTYRSQQNLAQLTIKQKSYAPYIFRKRISPCVPVVVASHHIKDVKWSYSVVCDTYRRYQHLWGNQNREGEKGGT
jgi:hypothetical protein